MGINREKIHNLVAVFYQPTFKTFYVNSVDGETFVKPIGVFVSLGITTSEKVLDDIKNIIISNGYKACIAEISSRKEVGQYLNTITNMTDPKQYRLTEFDDSVMTRDEAEAELARMKDLMKPDQSLEVLKEYAPKISKLQDLIGKLTDTDGWDAHLIQKDGSDYRIFHQYVNYQRVSDLEYRIGIYVSSENNN